MFTKELLKDIVKQIFEITKTTSFNVVETKDRLSICDNENHKVEFHLGETEFFSNPSFAPFASKLTSTSECIDAMFPLVKLISEKTGDSPLELFKSIRSKLFIPETIEIQGRYYTGHNCNGVFFQFYKDGKIISQACSDGDNILYGKDAEIAEDTYKNYSYDVENIYVYKRYVTVNGADKIHIRYSAIDNVDIDFINCESSADLSEQYKLVAQIKTVNGWRAVDSKIIRRDCNEHWL